MRSYVKVLKELDFDVKKWLEYDILSILFKTQKMDFRKGVVLSREAILEAKQASVTEERRRNTYLHQTTLDNAKKEYANLYENSLGSRFNHRLAYITKETVSCNERIAPREKLLESLRNALDYIKAIGTRARDLQLSNAILSEALIFAEDQLRETIQQEKSDLSYDKSFLRKSATGSFFYEKQIDLTRTIDYHTRELAKMDGPEDALVDHIRDFYIILDRLTEEDIS